MMVDREKVIKGMEDIDWKQEYLDFVNLVTFHYFKKTRFDEPPSYAVAKATFLGCLPEWRRKRIWINVDSALPAETHSIFWPWKDTAKWSNAMWAEQSDKVIVAIRFKDGTRIVRTGETHDGKWHTDISRTLEPLVTHWMPFPDLPKEENADADG